MVVPESSHDRSCSKESPKNVPSTITIPESAFFEFSENGALIGYGYGKSVCHNEINALGKEIESKTASVGDQTYGRTAD